MRLSSPCPRDADRRAAARARAPGPAVDRRLLAPAVERAPHQPRRRGRGRRAAPSSDDPRAAATERAALPERLGPPHVADARDEPLVEERLAERAALVRGAEAREHPVEVGRVGEDVRPEACDRAGPSSSSTGPVPEHRLPLARRGGRATAGRVACARRAARRASARSCAGGCAGRAALEAEEEVLAHAPRRRAGACPSRRSATPVTRARGCGVSTSTRSPTSTWRSPRRAVRAVSLGHSGKRTEWCASAQQPPERSPPRVWGAARADRPARLPLATTRTSRCSASSSPRPGLVAVGLRDPRGNGSLFGLAYRRGPRVASTPGASRRAGAGRAFALFSRHLRAR